MDKHEAVEILKELPERIAAVIMPSDRFFDYKEALEFAVSHLEADRWIPVSERLPGHDEYIKNNGLFNVSDGNRSYSEWFDIYDKQRFGEPTMAGFRVDYAVTAWRPLPKASESEEK